MRSFLVLSLCLGVGAFVPSGSRAGAGPRARALHAADDGSDPGGYQTLGSEDPVEAMRARLENIVGGDESLATREAYLLAALADGDAAVGKLWRLWFGEAGEAASDELQACEMMVQVRHRVLHCLLLKREAVCPWARARALAA